MKSHFRNMVSRNGWLKYVPNSLTLCNSLCGFAAIVYTLRAYDPGREQLGVFAAASWIILCAMIFDALDGFAARIFNAASMHGLQMDSLADMVTFGVAPATVVAIMTHSLQQPDRWQQEIWVYACCAIYLGCAALRLATYNVHAILEHKSGEKFSGMPSPGAAAAICSVIIAYDNQNNQMIPMAIVLPIYAAVLGLLMVSNIPYIHAAKWLLSVRRNRKNAAILIILLAVLIAFRSAGFAVLIFGYVLSGPLGLLFSRMRSGSNPKQEEPLVP